MKMTEAPQPTCRPLPPLPQGWHAVSYSVLGDGALAILGADVDLSAEWIRDRSGFPTGDPWSAAAKANARIWTLVDEELIEGPQFGLLTPHQHMDRFPDGRWLVAGARTLELGNARVITPAGEEVRRVHLGDGIGHLQIDDVGLIWVGWFDEGVFGNEDWRLPGFRWPPSADGLAAFDEHGTRVLRADARGNEAGIADCYALNVDGRTAFACTYQDFPIIQICGEAQTWTPTELSGSRALAVRLPYVLAAGGYAEKSARAVLVKLEQDRGRTTGVWRLPFQVGYPDGVQMIAGRGDTIHVVRNGVWIRWTIDDFISEATNGAKPWR